MNIKTDFPRQVRLLEDVWIPLSDGCRLSAKIWLPTDAEEDPVPAILEYLPYRKSDGTAQRDAATHAYFAGHGYAGVRVDIRGSGDSEGLLWDEYTQQEQDDAVEVIAWLASRPWSSGAVGMMGISWGGFNSLQVAARRPPALKAILSLCSTDDRYANDEHYIGGCVMGPEMQSYATMLLGYATHAPDPVVVGDGWRELWQRRLDEVAPALPTWLAHQRRDAYWQHGSVCEDYGAMECAVYMVGGWADGYRDAILRLLEHYRGPIKALIGPWCHAWPQHGEPGPAIGFLQEALRWWDHWLKGADTGIMDEPACRFWMQDAYSRSQDWSVKTGRWLTEDSWPCAKVTTRALMIGQDGLGAGLTGLGEQPAGLGEQPAEPSSVPFQSPQTTGIEGGCWISWSCEADSPADQRPDDERSQVFDSPPLTERLEVLGQAKAVLDIACDQPQALVAARLCDVDEAGASTLVARGVLNLTHREGHASPQPLVPGTSYRVEVPLAAAAYSFPPGHRVRLALSTSLWPLAWPSPRPVTMTLLTGESRLELPVLSERADQTPPAFMDPEEAPPPPGHEELEETISEIVIRRDLATGRVESTWDEAGRFRLGDGLVHEYRGRDTYAIVEGDPLSAEATSSWAFASERGDWRAKVEAKSRLTSNESDFHVTCSLDAYDGDVQVAARVWEATIPRDGC